MKFLLLFIGLVCCIAGLCLIKNDEQKKKSKWFILVGGLLIIANGFYLRYSVHNKIEISNIVVAIFCIIFLIIGTILYYKKWCDNLQWGFSSFIILALMFLPFGGKLPSVTLDNNVIEMSGKYGGSFNVSDIQSVDTVSIYPKPLYRRGGANGQVIHYGNFEMQHEKKLAKLCIYLNNPPYIKIRMNDNSLFLLNFKEPEKTVKFYDELKNIAQNQSLN